LKIIQEGKMDGSTQSFLYSLFLTLHNITRWLVVIFAVLALVRAFRGWFRRQEWTPQDNRAGVLFTSMLDTQLLLGLILYFLFSPATPQIFANFSGAMASPAVRFFGFEHVFWMVLAVVIAHVGRVLVKKAASATAQHRAAAISFGLAFLMVMAAIPWPFLKDFGRPWLRLFGIAL
jgi:hypothetical protein